MPSVIPSAPRILLVRFSSIGDIVLTTPLVRALRERHPGAHIAVLTKAAFRPLFMANPHIDELLVLRPGESLRHLAATIRHGHYSHLLDLHGNLRTRALRLLAPGRWRGYPKHRTARALLIRTKRDLYPGPTHVVERYFAAARDLDVRPDARPPELFSTAEATARAAEWLARAGLDGARPFIALAPGAAHATKRWPAESWVELAGRLGSTGVDVVLVGGPEDRMLAEAIAAEAGPRTVSAAGDFDLQGTGALLRRATTVVSGDTGVMHMATAVGRPVVALFGPTVEAFGFFPYSPTATVLQRPLDCRPCSRMGSAACPLGHHRCLREIMPAEVEAEVTRSVA